MNNSLNVTAIVLYFNDVNIIETIKSIENQTILPKEIIIIDDCSEMSIDVNYENPDCIIIRNNRNMGRGYSRNLAIKESANEFIVFCDSSNSLCKNFIKKARSEAESARISIRNARREILSNVKDLLKKKDITEDNERQIQEDVQKITDRFIKQVDEALLSKESDLLEI